MNLCFDWCCATVAWSLQYVGVELTLSAPDLVWRQDFRRRFCDLLPRVLMFILVRAFATVLPALWMAAGRYRRQCISHQPHER